MTREIKRLIREVKCELETEFEKKLFDACILSLNSIENPLRLNNFSTGIRELARHLLQRLAPSNEVLACSWYKNETNVENGITRIQRVMYSIHGGFPPNYVITKIGLNYNTLSNRYRKSIDKLNKLTHIEESTFDLPLKAVNLLAKDILVTFFLLFQSIQELRAKVVERIENKIKKTLVDEFLNKSFDEVDMLSTSNQIEGFVTESIFINFINSTTVSVEANGDVDVILSYGSQADIRNDDGFESSESYPFESLLNIEIANFDKQKFEVIKLEVDTDSFHK